MTHITNFLTLVIKFFLISLPVQLIGIVVVPIALLFPTPEFIPTSAQPHLLNHRLLKVFWLWGNRYNGIDGDRGWNSKGFNTTTYWARYRWLMRNRCSNLKFWFGVHTKIIKLTGYGAKWKEIGFGYWIAHSSKKRYFEYIVGIPYWKLKDGTYRGLVASVGYKNFNVSEKDLPRYYNYSFSIDVQPYRILNKRSL